MSGMAQAVTVEGDEPASEQVIEALAELEDVAADELDPIYDVIDLEALDRLVESGDRSLSVRWTMNGNLFAVDGSGTVTVE